MWLEWFVENVKRQFGCLYKVDRSDILCDKKGRYKC